MPLQLPWSTQLTDHKDLAHAARQWLIGLEMSSSLAQVVCSSLAAAEFTAAAGQRLRPVHCSARILWPGQATYQTLSAERWRHVQR